MRLSAAPPPSVSSIPYEPTREEQHTGATATSLEGSAGDILFSLTPFPSLSPITSKQPPPLPAQPNTALPFYVRDAVERLVREVLSG